MKPCAEPECGKMLQTWQQFGDDVQRPYCWQHWQAHQNGGQLSLPVVGDKPKDLFDVLQEQQVAA